MITSFGKYAVATAALVSAGGLGAVAAKTPAWAGGFSTTYTCDVPMLGARTAVLDGWLTSPGQTAVSRPTGFQLHISSMNMGAPVALNSWSASAWVTVGGAETSAFRMTGSGGYVPAGQPISGDLTGDWSPAVGGTDLLSVDRITISADTAITGTVRVRCVANEPRPVAETLSVQPSYYPGWSGPIAPPYQPGWAGPYRPGWHRPIGPPHHIGWHWPHGR